LCNPRHTAWVNTKEKQLQSYLIGTSPRLRRRNRLSKINVIHDRFPKYSNPEISLAQKKLSTSYMF
jgi:hypothetical protein